MIVLFITGVNILCFGIITKVYGIQTQFIPMVSKWTFYNKITAESGSLVGGFIALLGFAGAVGVLIYWGQQGFGSLVAHEMLRITLPSLALIVVGIHLVLTAFLVDILRIKARPVREAQVQNDVNDEAL